MDDGETVELFRPVGTEKLARIRELGFRAFPPRLHSLGELEEFNQNIVGVIEVVTKFQGAPNMEPAERTLPDRAEHSS